MSREETVLQIVAEVSGHAVSSLEAETPLVGELGIDSATALRLLLELEEALGVEIPDEAAAEMHTVGDILDWVR